MVGFPSPLAMLPPLAGVKDVTISDCPGNKLPALATKTRALLGRIAAWVGLIPISACPMSVSPETSIWSAAPGLACALELMPNTAWKFAALGVVTAMGITTGR